MPLKSTQTNKYETACFIQEAPEYIQEFDRRGLTVKHTSTGKPYCIFPACLQTYGCANRMRRRYDKFNVKNVIDTDERIQRLKYQNKWRGEWNHPNSWYKDKQYSDIRMTIPEPSLTSHFINEDRLEGDRLMATITTHPATQNGIAVNEEIIDLGVIPSFSVRILGNMIPNAPSGQPNIRVSKFITADMVDFPSHPNADAEIEKTITEYAQVAQLQEIAKYCAEQDEAMRVVCESFEFSPEDIHGLIMTGTDDVAMDIVQSNKSRIIIPMRSDIRREAANILKGLIK